MIFTDKGRTDFLDFVRNLPSQAFLLFAALMLQRGAKLDWSSPDPYISLFLFGLFVLAALANIMKFIDATLGKTNAVISAKQHLADSGKSGWRLHLLAFWQGRSDLFALLFVMSVGLSGFLVVFTVSVTNLLKTNLTS